MYDNVKWTSPRPHAQGPGFQSDHLVFIARQHVMHAERDIVLPILSVCLSVGRSVQCRYRV